MESIHETSLDFELVQNWQLQEEVACEVARACGSQGLAVSGLAWAAHIIALHSCTLMRLSCTLAPAPGTESRAYTVVLRGAAGWWLGHGARVATEL